MVLKNITLYILSNTLPTSFYILAIHWEQSHVWGLVVRKESRLAESSLKWFLQKPISQTFWLANCKISFEKRCKRTRILPIIRGCWVKIFKKVAMVFLYDPINMYKSRFTCYANLFGIYKSKYVHSYLPPYFI